MKKFLFLTLCFFFSFFVFAQEEVAPVEKQEQKEEIQIPKGEKNVREIKIEVVYGFWVGLDKEKNTFKIKTDDQIMEFKFEKDRIRLFGKQKNLRMKDFKEGDFVKVLYRKEEGANIAKRIIKDPKKPESTTPSTPGN